MAVRVEENRPEQDRGLGELLGELGSQVAELISLEMRLAQAELKADAAKAARAGGMMGAAALAGYLALLLAAFAAAWGLAYVIPIGWAFLVVALGLGIAAAVLLQQARRRMEELDLVPERTVRTVKEDVQWARDQMR